MTRLPLFPITTQIIDSPAGKRLSIGGCDLDELANRFGTPLYLYDQATLNSALGGYRQALSKYYPGQASITYAGKAFLCLEMARWVKRQGLLLDCTGQGELSIAHAAGLERGDMLMHGVNKSSSDLEAAVSYASTVVVDNPSELERLAELHRRGAEHFPDLWLRLRPGLAVQTHAYTQTGQADSKFGMSQEELWQSVQFCLDRGLPLTGLHFHQGSHFHDPAPVAPAIEAALDLIAGLSSDCGWQPEVLCPGGGWGVPYSEADLPHKPVHDYVALIANALVRGCEARRLHLPRLQLEPGRSLVARAGVAVYTVGAVKETPTRRWLMLDGGLADNPRPALYRARYTALPTHGPERPYAGKAWMAGPFCESGDVLIEGLPMPDVQPGERIAVPVAGAYQLSMGSNYNGALKPAVVWLDNGEARLARKRETLEDLTRLDL